ncbi:MAG: chloride channel protein [Taibaiella sp.]|nr:chloride channel protein [Taibaiella sp.]
MTNKTSQFSKIIDRDWLRENVIQAVPFWVASIATGLVSVLYTRLFNLSESWLAASIHYNKYLIFIIAPASFALAWWIVARFAPGARGSGIPQVMATIEMPASKHDTAVPKLLGLRIMIVKIISSVLMVFGGGAIGREGPTIQIAGSVFYLINKWLPSSWSKLSKKSYFITGAAAGLAAAFNTPLGGVVFAIEELARVHVSFFRTALFSAVIIAGLTAQGMLGPYLYLGYPEVKGLQSFIFLGVAATAIIAGVTGAAVAKLILRIIAWKRKFSGGKTLLFAIVAGLITATIAFFFDDSILGSGKELMNTVLFSSDKHVTLATMLSRVIGPVLSFNVGAAGGVFAPALASGAAIGSFISGLAGMVGANSNMLVLAGMVGFLTGVTRTPVTSAILVLEMTDRHSVVFHLMLAALVSGLAATAVDQHSFYEQLKNHYLEETVGKDEKEEEVEEKE